MKCEDLVEGGERIEERRLVRRLSYIFQMVTMNIEIKCIPDNTEDE